MLLKKSFILLTLFFIFSCSAKVQITKPIEVSVASGLKKIPGKYAAYIQTGGWQLETESTSFACSAWTFEADINQPYYNAIKKILSEIFEDITFTENILSKNEISDFGYLAQISILQTSAKANFDFHGTGANFIFFLNSIVSAQNNKGLIFQKNVSAEGLGQEVSNWTCNAQEGARMAVQNSIEQLIDLSSMYLYEGIKKDE